MKAEVLCYPGRSAKANPRFLVTNLPHRPATVYTRLRRRPYPMSCRLAHVAHATEP
jgi:hypothetical protein